MLQTILVNIIYHPVESRNVTVVELPYRRQTLFQIKEQFVSGQNVIMGLDGKQCDDWGTVVKPFAKVMIMPAAADPATAVYLGLHGWLAIGAYVAVNMAIAYGLSYLGGVLFGPDMKEAKDEPTGQSFAWNPHTIQREGGPHPMCYGTNMHYGNIVARWTDVDESGNEILYMILDYGRGPVQGRGSNKVFFNDQPEDNFPDITIQERLGTLNQTCMTGFEKNKLEYRQIGGEITNADGPVTITTPNNFFDDIEYTLEWPKGIWYYHKSGGRDATYVGVKVEISEHGEDSWTTLMDTNVYANQRHPLYKAYKVSEQGFSCTHGKQYDLRFWKTSGDSVERYCSDMRLRSVREVVNVAFTRPGKALLGIKALATSRLSGHIDVKWVADDKLVRWFNGTSWGFKFTRNRAWVVLDILTQPIVSGDGSANPWTIERYEGLDPSRIDLAFFYEWAEWCDQQVPSGIGEETEDRMTCDIICDFQTDVWSLAYEISQVGRMYPYWQGNILTGWVDKAVDDVIDLVTMDNTMIRSWKNASAGYGELVGSIEVFYKDKLQGYERKNRPVHNESAGTYTRVISIEGIGITGQALATRVGNHALQRNKLIKNVNSVRMYKDALRYRLGQVIRLQSNVPNWGASYRVIKSEANNTVELDRTCTAEADDIIYIRSYDEAKEKVSIDSYTVDSVSGAVVTITETWNVTPIKNNIAAIGEAGAIKLRRITKMRHTADNYFDLELETYDANLFDSDDIPPYIDNPDYAWPAPASPLMKPVSRWEVIDLIEKYMPPRPNTEAPVLANCEWTGNEVDTVTWSKRDSDDPIEFYFRGVSYKITPDSTTMEFVYWDPDYTTMFRKTNSAAVAHARGKWIMCRNIEGVPYPATPMQLMHAGILQAGTITAELGQIAAQTVGTAEIKDLAVETLKIKDEAVTLGVSAYTAADGATGDIQTVEITTTGQPVTITGSFLMRIQKTDDFCRWSRIKLLRNATEVYDSSSFQCWVGNAADTHILVSVGTVDQPSADTYTYKLNLTGTGVLGGKRFLFAQEVKK